MSDAAPGREPNPRRELTVAVLLAVLGSAIALFAASRNWVVIETRRPDPLPPVREIRSGRDAVPWAAAMSFVGLAGGIALLATKRLGRLLVGVVVALSGAIMVAGGVAGWLTDGADYEQVTVTHLWPAASVVGGLAAFVAGSAGRRPGPPVGRDGRQVRRPGRREAPRGRRRSLGRPRPWRGPHRPLNPLRLPALPALGDIFSAIAEKMSPKAGV